MDGNVWSGRAQTPAKENRGGAMMAITNKILRALILTTFLVAISFAIAATASAQTTWVANGNNINNTNTGNVGIGTTAPLSALHVASETFTRGITASYHFDTPSAS